MVPAAIGSMQLDVGEGYAWFERFDAGSPAKRKPMQLQLVIDQGSRSDGRRRRAEKPETDHGRRDSLEVLGVGKEGEYLGAGPRDDLRSLETIGSCHRALLPCSP